LEKIKFDNRSGTKFPLQQVSLSSGANRDEISDDGKEESEEGRDCLNDGDEGGWLNAPLATISSPLKDNPPEGIG
jgi:hypothetical protein